jgi:hypothetical protein
LFDFGLDLDVLDAAGHEPAKDWYREARARDFRPVRNHERAGFRGGFIPGNDQIIPLTLQKDIGEVGIGGAEGVLFPPGLKLRKLLGYYVSFVVNRWCQAALTYERNFST